jgi:riboflavin synthase
MFTGIVEERGGVRSLAGRRLVVACDVVRADSPVGASVSVNGVCLTVVDASSDSLSFDLSEETAARTSLTSLVAGDPVNLERPVSLAARLGGHLVQGHVDGVARVTAVTLDGVAGARVELVLPHDLERYVVEKGSIAIDGVGLTVASAAGDRIEVALIPHTLAVTTLGSIRQGDRVNVEVDLMAKYVERLLEGPRS